MTIDTRKLEAAINAAFKDTALIVDLEFTKAITDPVYPWPRGESPRDVVDTGRLRSSQTFNLSGDRASWSWPTEYSIIVHNGAVLRSGTVLPARPWTTKALEKRNPSEVFAKLLEGYL